MGGAGDGQQRDAQVGARALLLCARVEQRQMGERAAPGVREREDCAAHLGTSAVMNIFDKSSPEKTAR
jgi:hypothetical protein